jgi:hypothetical protein
MRIRIISILIAICAVAAASELTVTVSLPPQFILPLKIEACERAELYLGRSGMQPPQMVVSVRDKSWIKDFASHLHHGCEVEHFGATLYGGPLLTFCAGNGETLPFFLVGEQLIWKDCNRLRLYRISREDGVALESMVLAIEKANHLPDPTSPSVTPAAVAAGAPSVAADH